MKKYLNNLLYILLIFPFFSCLPEKSNKKKIEISKILIDKHIQINNGDTRYLLAFSDGWTEQTSFGYYSCLNIGDTVKFTKYEGDDDFWLKMIPNCEQKQNYHLKK